MFFDQIRKVAQQQSLNRHRTSNEKKKIGSRRELNLYTSLTDFWANEDGKEGKNFSIQCKQLRLRSNIQGAAKILMLLFV